MTLSQKTRVTKLPCWLTADVPSCVRLGWWHPRWTRCELLLKGQRRCPLWLRIAGCLSCPSVREKRWMISVGPGEAGLRLIVLTSWSAIPRLDVFFGDFRNHTQLCLAVLMGYSDNNWTSLCCFQLAIFPPRSKHRGRILYILNLLSISPPKCALMLQEGRHGSRALGFLDGFPPCSAA